MPRNRTDPFGQQVPAGMKSLGYDLLRELLVEARERDRPSLGPDWFDAHASGAIAHLRVVFHETYPPSGWRCEVFIQVDSIWRSFLLDIAEKRFANLPSTWRPALRREALRVARLRDGGRITLMGYGPDGLLRID